MYFVANVAVLAGYATEYFSHRFLTPVKAIEILIYFSLATTVATPVAWCLWLRLHVGVKCMVLLLVMNILAVVLNLLFYWLAIVAV